MYTNLTNDYLTGKKFTNGAKVSLKNLKCSSASRDEYLVKMCENKKVLHFGFLDHLPLIDGKIEADRWLHKKLMGVSKVCYGLDLDKKGVEYIQSKYNYENLYALDILKDELPDEIQDESFDYILVPDVIEHLGNPVQFLTAIRQRLMKNTKKMFITVPHALRYNNILNSFKDIEHVNSDHRFWFTPYTIAKIVTDAGFVLEKISLTEHGGFTRNQIFKKMLVSKYPVLHDTLIAEVR
ncbi:MAG: methyltransferase domain-containing protein [Candidatus Marinimicrobia bacterium]|nr:methyltransferase domain-containing protein [Candidatus Neomarinimicrobiota bacterium]MBT4362145.1 methyltransferase domain-containing protein [Candidatus Neomarinimicrobiota bacterium]MBT4713668.1 methyltransferase domain-containing protein [Candidatus Neomarinimicrobiota bacterium]MBT4945200.1 methyltransferase domain-containing protein [Candidatus Neomarinimicrobiota bacterium]MBT5268810.1 methyltransferase domain-containing protein [Candidatus Neomarinimicrobiota bacterium]